jgi:hypothetical protein
MPPVLAQAQADLGGDQAQVVPAPRWGVAPTGQGGGFQGMGRRPSREQLDAQRKGKMAIDLTNAGRGGELDQQVLPSAPSLGSKDIKKGKSLGGGSANDVHRVQTKQTMAGTDTKVGYFKADRGEKEMAPHAGDRFDADIGQQEGDSHMAARAVASARLDSALGTNVLSQDRFGEYKGQTGLVSPEVAGKGLYEQVWTAGHKGDQKKTKDGAWEGLKDVELARKSGKKWEHKVGTEYEDFDFSKPETQRGFADLQFNDYLTGQVDRHGKNIKIDERGGVKGIDNDLAFGKADLTQRDIPQGHHARDEEQKLQLPEQIDARTAHAFMGMSEDDFVATIAGEDVDPSRLSQEEIDNAKQRYRDLQEHVRKLADDDKLVSEWNDDTFQAATADENMNSSYLNRSVKMLGAARDRTADNFVKGDDEQKATLTAHKKQLRV